MKTYTSATKLRKYQNKVVFKSINYFKQYRTQTQYGIFQKMKK